MNCDIDEIIFWWMNDNHTFVKLKGNSLDEIISHANRMRKRDPYGGICPATIFYKGKEIKRVGEIACSWGKEYDDMWNESVQLWRKSIEEDQDVMQFLKGVSNGRPNIL